MEEKKVTLLFTTYHNFVSYFLHFVFSHSYSHVSLALDTNNDYFYSFNKKGFRREFPKKHKKRWQKSYAIQFTVTDEQFEALKETIEVWKKKENTKYSAFGVILCLLHISHHFEDSYFCSRFVAEAMRDSGKFELKKDPSLYLPDQIIDELIVHGCLENVLRNPI